ncbi:non-heme bromoperoxidase BPO-A2 protein [Sphingopyxis sp. EG6]|nr:non-heme bromoperoxidase BPO-A2 protein [Sphingopyxis sp. EG6]
MASGQLRICAAVKSEGHGIQEQGLRYAALDPGFRRGAANCSKDGKAEVFRPARQLHGAGVKSPDHASD